jgi:Mrp family chromosome partitioning ATPase
MTRTLEALKTLDVRRLNETEPARREMAMQQVPTAVSSEMFQPLVPQASLPLPTALPHQREVCTLAANVEVPRHYLDLARRIGEQLAANYCNVVLFVTPDHAAEPSFSLVQLAQAFTLQSVGEVLVIDGDLRCGRLSKSVCPSSRGMIEAMLGTASWTEIIHPTNLARIDFVAAGKGQIPTFERPDFGFGTLRSKYRAVLIGTSVAGDPEINWLSARCCDAVYCVISRPYTKRQTASETVNALRAGGANVRGCVVVDG